MFLGCLISQHCVFRGPAYWYYGTCCHTETEMAVQMCYLTLSPYTDTGLARSDTDTTASGRVTSGVPVCTSLVEHRELFPVSRSWQGDQWSTSLYLTGRSRPGNTGSYSRSAAPGRVTTGVPVCTSLVGVGQGTQGAIPGLPLLAG